MYQQKFNWQRKRKRKLKIFSGKCDNCSKIDHKIAECWELEKNKDKMNFGYKTTDEKEISSANDYVRGIGLLLMTVYDDYEFDFMTLIDDTTFVSDTSILREPNVFIDDTGATSDTTPFLYGLENAEEARKEYAAPGIII